MIDSRLCGGHSAVSLHGAGRIYSTHKVLWLSPIRGRLALLGGSRLGVDKQPAGRDLCCLFHRFTTQSHRKVLQNDFGRRKSSGIALPLRLERAGLPWTNRVAIEGISGNIETNHSLPMLLQRIGVFSA